MLRGLGAVMVRRFQWLSTHF